MDRANYELAWYLAEEMGSAVHLVSYNVIAPLSEHARVVWHRVPKAFGSYTLAGPLLTNKAKRLARTLAAKGALRVIVNGGNCDWPDINWVHAVHAAWESRDAHASLSVRMRAAFSKHHAVRAERRSLKQARIIVANSNTARQQIISGIGVPPERVHTVYYGTDPGAFRPATPEEQWAARARLGWADPGPVVAFIGALGYDRNKGFDVLFDAWKELCHDPSWDANLVALGAGAEIKLWRAAVASSGLEERIRMMGFTRDVPDVLRAADVLVHPTHYEAYGLSVQEALCCGVPALVTRCAGVAERYPAELSDLLINDPPSVKDLVQRLRRWRCDIEGWRARVAGFGAKLRQRTWTDMAREFVELTTPSPEKASASSLICV
jgi:glycosyltransferase involved in cell wall biosynthesis